MGRKKVPLELIKNDKSRRETFKKRLKGLKGKAFQLSKLCNVQVGVIVINEGKIHESGYGGGENFKEEEENFKEIIAKYVKTYYTSQQVSAFQRIMEMNNNGIILPAAHANVTAAAATEAPATYLTPMAPIVDQNGFPVMTSANIPPPAGIMPFNMFGSVNTLFIDQQQQQHNKEAQNSDMGENDMSFEENALNQKHCISTSEGSSNSRIDNPPAAHVAADANGGYYFHEDLDNTLAKYQMIQQSMDFYKMQGISNSYGHSEILNTAAPTHEQQDQQLHHESHHHHHHPHHSHLNLSNTIIDHLHSFENALELDFDNN